MKTNLLIDVPKTGLSRGEKISAFKKENGIVTHYSYPYDEMPWMAAHMPSVYKLGYGVEDGMSLGECAALVCRLMDECGLTAYGKGELTVIRELCSKLNINFNL